VFYHLCALENWRGASTLLLSHLDVFEGTPLSLKLDTWGYCQQAIVLCQQLLSKVDDDIDITCFIAIGDGYIDLGEYENAVMAYQQGLERASEVDDALRAITNLYCLGLVCHYQSKYLKAIEYYQKCLDAEIRLEDLTVEFLAQKARVLGNLGLTYHQLDRYPESFDCHERSLALFQQLGDLNGEMIALRGLGTSHNTLGNYNKALQCGQKALEIAQELSDRSSEAEALNILGMAYRNLEDFSQALDYHQQQLSLAVEIGDIREEGYAVGNLSVVFERMDDFEQSLEYAKRHLDIAIRLGDRRSEGAALYSCAGALLNLEKSLEGVETMKRALEIFRDVGSQSEEADALYDLAIVSWEAGNDAMAMRYCDQALAIAEKLELTDFYQECQDLMQEFQSVSER